MRRTLNLLHQAKKWLFRTLRVRTRGVRVMLFNENGQLLLIRHTYGRSKDFLMPGGGMRPWEKPHQAARREVAEEVGCRLTGLEFVSTHVSHAEGRRDTIHLYKADSADEPRADGVEVEEARYFSLDELPKTLSPATRRRIEEHLGMRARDRSW